MADTLELPEHKLWKESIVFLPEKDLEKIDNILAEISPEKEKEMRKNCLKLYNYFKTNYANKKIKKKMVIFTNCHGEKYLKIFKRDSNVHDVFDINYIVSYQQLNNFDRHKKAFEVADVLIINNIKNYNQFTLNNIKKLMKKDAQLIVLPFVRFNGYWLPEKTKRLRKIGANSVEHFPDIKLSDVDSYITDQVNSETFKNYYKNCLNKLKSIENESDVKFYDFFIENHLKYPMFRDAYHPTLNIIEYVGSKLLQLIEKKNDIIVKKSEFSLLKETNEYGHYKPIKDSVKTILNITYDLDKVFICDRKTYLEKILEYEVSENRNIKDLDDMLHILKNNSPLYSGNEVIKKLILKNEPFSITRLGCAISAISRIYLENDIIDNYQKKIIQSHDGIYWNNEEDIIKYIQYYTNAIKKSDYLASFERIYTREQNYFIKNYDLKTIHSRVLEPFYIDKDPWSLYLSGKKVLIINPFVESFKKQMHNGFRIFKDREIFKTGQKFVYYKPFNCLAGNRPHKDWFETFEAMCKDIKEIEFDIALLGCGGYGLPLCDYIKTHLKKSAIYVGGGLQLLFGVMGCRWEKNKMWEKIIRENNCKFIRPSGEEIIKGNEQIEDSCYW